MSLETKADGNDFILFFALRNTLHLYINNLVTRLHNFQFIVFLFISLYIKYENNDIHPSVI